MKITAKRILWPTDFSDLSLKAGQCAHGLCELFDAHLHVIHVCPPPLAPHIQARLPAEVCKALGSDELRGATRSRLEQVVHEHFDGLKGVRCEALAGHPWSQICAYAEREKINLIVVSTHGFTGLRHVLIGGTAERIVQHAPCAVLTVKSY